MNVKGNLLFVAVMVGAVAAAGCKSQDKITDTGNDKAASEQATPATPEDNPDSAPVSEESVDKANPGVEKDAAFYTYWAYRAPPALRVEEMGVAPHAGWWHRPGYWGWGGRDYRWNAGRWYAPRAGYEYVYPRWHHVGTRWGYYPGRWWRR